MSRTFRIYSSQIEVYNLTALFLLSALLGLVRPRRAGGARLLTPVRLFLAMCFHQTALFFGAAILAWELTDAMAIGRWPQAARNLVLPGAAIGLALPRDRRASGLSRARRHQLLDDALRPLRLGLWGKGDVSLHTLVAAAIGLASTFAPLRLAPVVALLLIIYIAARIVEAPGRVTSERPASSSRWPPGSCRRPSSRPGGRPGTASSGSARPYRS